MDPNDVTNRHNLEEQTVFTPSKVDFDAYLNVELTLRSDGTAAPRFIYKVSSQHSSEVSKEGRKFFVDMTDSTPSNGEAYVGLDFGSANTAISYIDRGWIEAIEVRSRDSSWKEVGELVDLLPAPLATPLAKYIGDVIENSPVPPGFSFIEAALCMLAYATYIDFCSSSRRATTRIFKGFAHRSAGYLWHLLKELTPQVKERSAISFPVSKLMERGNSSLVDRTVKNWASTRHELMSTDRDDLLSTVRLLANISCQVFGSQSFGFFEGVQKERFSARHAGRYRVAHGKPPHSSFVAYAGSNSWSEAEAMLVNTENGKALALAPLIFWYPCANHPDSSNGHCYFFDKITDSSEPQATFKAANSPCTLVASVHDPELGPLVKQLREFKVSDPCLQWISDLSFETKQD